MMLIEMVLLLKGLDDPTPPKNLSQDTISTSVKSNYLAAIYESDYEN